MTPPEPDQDPVVPKGAAPDAQIKGTANNSEISPTDEASEASTLTPEEQMALYEKELKENDWATSRVEASENLTSPGPLPSF